MTNVTNVVSFPDSSRRLRRARANYCAECGTPFKSVTTESTKSIGWKIVSAFWSLALAGFLVLVILGI